MTVATKSVRAQIAIRSETGGGKVLSAVRLAAVTTVILSALAVIIFSLISLDRAFEITDEAYYLLLAMHPDAAKLYISAQQWVMAPLWRVAGSLVLYRATGLAILLGGSAVLAHGVRIAFERTGLLLAPWSSVTILAATVVGGLLYIATINLSPCYNLLASAGAYAAAGLTLIALDMRRRWSCLALFALAGAALSVEFVSKPSAGMATFGLLSLWTLLLVETKRQGVANCLATAVFFALSVIGLALSNQKAAEIASSLSAGLELFRMAQAEPVDVRLLRYAMELQQNYWDAIRSFWLTIAVFGLYLLTRRAISIVVLMGVLGFTLVKGGYVLGGADHYAVQIKAVAILFLCILAVSAPAWSRNWRAIVLVLGMAALPYSIAVGTGNALFTQIIVSMAPWTALAGVLALLDRDQWPDRIMQLMLLAVLVLVLAMQIVTSGFRTPYHLATPAMQQTTPVDIGDLGRVKVDAGTARFVRDLDAAVATCDIAPKSPFLGLYNIPGVALATRSIPIVTPWINNVAQAATILSRAPAETGPLVIAILRNQDGSRPEFPSALASFPAGFKFCAEAAYPFGDQHIEVWRRILP